MKNVIAAITTVSMLLAPLGLDLDLGNEKAGDAIRHIEIVGYRGDARQTVALAVKRFSAAGLELPPLTIFIHHGNAECKEARGLYGRDGDAQRVDICTDDERIIIHELAHAWEQHQVDDEHRNSLLEAWDLEFWQNLDIPHHKRGIEIAANVMAIGLMFRPLSDTEANLRSETLDRFEALTGMQSPRIVAPAADLDSASL